jgi:hypothetical protein
MSALGLTHVRNFISEDPYNELVPDAAIGEIEYEITRTTWRPSIGVDPSRPS